VATSAKVDEFNSKIEKEFSLITCMTSFLANSIWYIDSGASSHMTGNKEYFNQLTKKDIEFHIELGDGGRYLTNVDLG